MEDTNKDEFFNFFSLVRNHSVTAVSGYWDIKSKYKSSCYTDWMRNSLKINCPYVFFGNKKTIEFVKKIRAELPTYYIEMEIEDFYTYKYKNMVLPHPIHSPSTELTLIWDEKVILIEKAKNINPFNSEFFIWIDAGIFVYRHSPPPITVFPNPSKILSLPKDKFIFSTSDNPVFEKHKVHDNYYYHYISGTFMIHKNIVNYFSTLYKEYIDKYLSKPNWIFTDQKILTHVYNDHPELFYCFSHGYGSIIKKLYE